MREIRIRRAEARDRDVLVDFNRRMALETEGKELERSRLERGVSAVLRDPALGSYRIAERDGEVVGALLLTHEWSDWRDAAFWWIQSVYVVPQARRTGVFRALYDALLSEANERPDVCGLRLYVERENARAQAVYSAVGMRASRYRLFEVDFVLGAAEGRSEGTAGG